VVQAQRVPRLDGQEGAFCRDFGRLVRWYGLLSNVLFCRLLGASSAIYAVLQYAEAIGQRNRGANVKGYGVIVMTSDKHCPLFGMEIVGQLFCTLYRKPKSPTNSAFLPMRHIAVIGSNPEFLISSSSACVRLLGVPFVLPESGALTLITKNFYFA
jgi:hypothetical protein